MKKKIKLVPRIDPFRTSFWKAVEPIPDEDLFREDEKALLATIDKPKNGFIDNCIHVAICTFLTVGLTTLVPLGIVFLTHKDQIFIK